MLSLLHNYLIISGEPFINNSNLLSLLAKNILNAEILFTLI